MRATASTPKPFCWPDDRRNRVQHLMSRLENELQGEPGSAALQVLRHEVGNPEPDVQQSLPHFLLNLAASVSLLAEGVGHLTQGREPHTGTLSGKSHRRHCSIFTELNICSRWGSAARSQEASWSEHTLALRHRPWRRSQGVRDIDATTRSFSGDDDPWQRHMSGDNIHNSKRRAHLSDMDNLLHFRIRASRRCLQWRSIHVDSRVRSVRSLRHSRMLGAMQSEVCRWSCKALCAYVARTRWR